MMEKSENLVDLATGDLATSDLAASHRKRENRLLATLAKDRKAQFGLVVLTLFVLGAIFAPWLAPNDPNEMTLDMMNQLSWAHPLGTDDLGRDLFSRILFGTRISLFIGISTVVIALLVGVTLGIMAGYFGGRLDFIIMRYIDLQWAFPNFIIAVYLVAVFGTGLFNIIAAISLAFIDDFARVARSMTLTIREEQYIDAARTLGLSDKRILFAHILPNAMPPIIVQATVSVSYAILGRGQSVVPRAGRQCRHTNVGANPSRWPRLYQPGVVAGCVPGTCHHAGRVVDQLHRRLAA